MAPPGRSSGTGRQGKGDGQEQERAEGGRDHPPTLAIGVGALLGSRLPERAIKVFAAGAFVVFGVILVLQGLGVV